MRFRIAVVALFAVWVVGVSRVPVIAEQAAPAQKTIWDGVYTDDQAKRGETAFTASCQECHGQDMAGDGFAPALAGGDFNNNWNTLTVADLYERIRISMPPNNPSGVTPQQKADIVAYILKYNKLPAGKTELSAKPEDLKAIQFVATKPGL
jgi:mono/diheme cytochrome c family protein